MAAASPAPTPDVSRARFAAFVARTLAAARDRGMNDKAIRQATGVPPSTFHRWQKGNFKTAPDLDKVRAFCDGLGVSPAGAAAALGLSLTRDNPEPEPPLPPEIRKILRTLADPNVPDSDKLVLREMLKMLAERAERGGR
ncbi:XRE family transcriptional regulator [Micromonospora sp. NPDC048999]|uniref:helix-turn-helix domain-containing protein n=1 Tax=Micromonospora sp. NPDC048999 TaxID=3155391 RepID=UPI0033E7D872